MKHVDFHCHCLPGMDDGAADVETAAAMLETLAGQGVCAVAATSHFDAREESAADFVSRRSAALGKVLDHAKSGSFPDILPGAEVYLSRSIEPRELRPLCIGELPAILLELPRCPYKSWIADCIANIAYSLSVTPILAHLERYIGFYKREELEEVLDAADSVVQFNIGSLSSHDTRKQIKSFYEKGVPLALGSDAHNLTTRRPNWDSAQGYLSKTHKGVSRQEWFVTPAFFAQGMEREHGLIL